MGDKIWENLNQCSIGIELINLNGNMFSYPDAQYAALHQLTQHLQERYPALMTSPDRVVGHEHIAGWRGKVDPGRYFDWSRYFKMNFSDFQTPWPDRSSLVDEKIWRKFVAGRGEINPKAMTDDQWPALSVELEAFMSRENRHV